MNALHGSSVCIEKLLHTSDFHSIGMKVIETCAYPLCILFGVKLGVGRGEIDYY